MNPLKLKGSVTRQFLNWRVTGKCYRAVFFYSGVFQESFTEHIAGKCDVKGSPVAVLQPNSNLLNREI